MQCQEFLEYAGQWMEGEQAPAASAHLDACPRCRGLIADLGDIRAAAGKLEAEVDPPAQMWISIRAQLEAEGIIREQSRSWSEQLAEWFHPSPRLALAGVYLALVLIASVLVSFDGARNYEQARAIAVPMPEIATSITALPNHIQESSNPMVAASYRDSLHTIDSLIVECETMVRHDPQNELARDYLYGAYQQKAELLSAMMERGTYGE